MGRKDQNKHLPKTGRADLDAFLNTAATLPKPANKDGGRLLFAMDATASRQATWDQACHIQASMFAETSDLGGLQLQLCYYRGYGEFESGTWVNNAAALTREMAAVFCLGGHTQIEKVLQHGLAIRKTKRLDAIVFVGDCMEENPDLLCDLAGQLGLHGIPLFIFNEGNDARASKTFQQLAHLSNGACLPFDLHSAQRLKDLLTAVAVYVAGGYQALEEFGASRPVAQEVVQLLTKNNP